MTAFEIVRNALLAGFGVQEKMREFVDDLVKKGELSESQGAKLVKEWTDKVEKNTEDMSKSVGDAIKKTLEKMKLPTKDDIDRMNEKVNALSLRLKKLEGVKEEGQ